MKNLYLFLIILLGLTACVKEKTTQIENPMLTPDSSKILTLKVNYLSNEFEGAIETTYNSYTSTFTVSTTYTPPSDFGYLQLRYQELNQIIFSGSIVWLGLGTVQYPQNLIPPAQFDTVSATNIIYPISGFENVFNPYNEVFNYSDVWASIQKLDIVRNYLQSNPNVPVKLFLYTPTVGLTDPSLADWYIFLKK